MSIEYVLDEGLKGRFNDPAQEAHYRGTEAELRELTGLGWEYVGPKMSKIDRDVFELRHISTAKFARRDGKPVTALKLLVRIGKRGNHGLVKQVILFDFQAISAEEGKARAA